MRTDPPVSVPSPAAITPSAIATAAPPLEPPGMRCGSCGWRVSPKAALAVVTPQANSCVVVLPTTIAPCSTSVRTTQASAEGMWPMKAGDP